MYTSDLRPDPDSPGSALIVLLTSLGAVRPSAVFDNSLDWRTALSDLRAVDVLIEQKSDGHVALLETAPEPGRLTEAERVRSLVLQSPSWVRAVTASRQWAVVVRRVSEGRPCSEIANSARLPTAMQPSRFGLGATLV